MRKIYYNIVITALSVAVAWVIGSIELLVLFADEFGWRGSFLGLAPRAGPEHGQLRRRRHVRPHLGGDPADLAVRTHRREVGRRRSARRHRPRSLNRALTVGPHRAGRQTGRVPGSLRDVLPVAAALLGIPDAGHEPGGSAVTDWVGAERVDRVLVLLVDGLGWQLLAQLAGDAPLLAAVRAGEVGRLTRLDCTFPSTTPTSLVPLATGAAPGQHGILGFTLRVPGTDRVLNHVRWRDDPAPDAWQPLPTWFERLAAAGGRARAVLPSSFLGSGLTEAAYRGARLVPAEPADDYPRLVGNELRAGPGLVYGYTGELDTAAHLFGIGSPQWHTAAAAVDALLSGLLDSLPPMPRCW